MIAVCTSDENKRKRKLKKKFQKKTRFEKLESVAGILKPFISLNCTLESKAIET